MRLDAKLWDKCLRKNIKLDERQKGFLPVDGCFENVQILKEVIKQQRKKRREYNLAFKDLAKAFDTVSCKSIEKGLRRKGVPAVVRETVMEMYKKATTRVTVGGKTTRRIKINSGVKQRCPLSPLLFNQIIDELLEKLKKKNIVIKIDNEIICCMAFADDLVILMQERIEMQILLEECKEFCDAKGLRANAGKCASMRVVPVKGKQSMKVITRIHGQWGTQNIPSITFQDLVKYLGANIQPDGSVKLPSATWREYLQRLISSHLNPIEKIEAIRHVLTAKIQYHLRLSDHGLEMARKLNREIRKAANKILNLPTWMPTNWINHRNGANIPDLLLSTMQSRTKATTKMKLSEDPISRSIGDRQPMKKDCKDLDTTSTTGKKNNTDKWKKNWKELTMEKHLQQHYGRDTNAAGYGRNED